MIISYLRLKKDDCINIHVDILTWIFKYLFVYLNTNINLQNNFLGFVKREFGLQH